jgi:hypothetical protein
MERRLVRNRFFRPFLWALDAGAPMPLRAKGHQGERTTGIVGPDQGDLRPNTNFGAPTGQHCDGATSDCIVGETSAVGYGSRQGRKQEAALDHATIGAQSCDVDGSSAIGQYHIGAGEFPEKHPPSVSVLRVTSRSTSVGHQNWTDLQAFSRFDSKHSGGPTNDRADRRRGIGARRDSTTGLGGFGLVENDEYDVSRIIYRKSRQEGIEPL